MAASAALLWANAVEEQVAMNRTASSAAANRRGLECNGHLSTGERASPQSRSGDGRLNIFAKQSRRSRVAGLMRYSSASVASQAVRLPVRLRPDTRQLECDATVEHGLVIQAVSCWIDTGRLNGRRP